MAEQFQGLVEIQNAAGNTRVGLDGNNGDVAVGGNGADGDLVIRDDSGNQTHWARSQNRDLLMGPAVPGQTRLILQGHSSGRAYFRDANGRNALSLNGGSAALVVGTTDNEGDLTVRDGSNRSVFSVDGNSAMVTIGANGNEGDLLIRDQSGRNVFTFDGNSAALYIGANGNEGDLQIRDGSGRTVFNCDSNTAALYLGATGNAGDLRIRDGGGRTVFNFNSNSSALYIGANGNEGDIQVRDGAGRTVFNFNGDNAALYLGASGNEGDLILRNNSGADTIHLDGGSGDIILKNADAAEHFDVADALVVEQGSVMVLDDEGLLVPASNAYDRRVVGVVAGAGDYRPGIVFDHRNDGGNRVPISVLGKVSCFADAAYGRIAVGDLLTTSPTEGHAMKSTDPIRAIGAVMGKALGSLESGRGLIPILVTLQ